MRYRRCFVQFIHPGGEHWPDTATTKAWNTGPHRRKFLRARGQYVASPEEVEHGDIAFWGEWEAESDVARRYDGRGPAMPHFLYDPYFVRHRDEQWRQNTDPFVFGDRFHYTGCLQHTRRGPTQLRYLAPGSVILFGSCQERSRFVIDTVFIVADSIDHTAADYREQLGGVDPTYWAVTIEPWYRGQVPADQSHRVYYGATADGPIHDMFSFFPCRPLADGSEAFARPTIRLPGYITPHLTQGKKIARDLSLSELGELWHAVADQVEEQGCALGVHAQMPPERAAAA